MKFFKASCHCGSVKWSFNLPVKMVVQCHCDNCRKMQGTDYTTWVAVPDNQFSVDEGGSLISRYAFNKKSSKSFCSSCGATVCGVNEKHFSEHKVVPLGAIENYSDEIKPQVQVYTEDKAPWVQIHDGVPVYKG